MYYAQHKDNQDPLKFQKNQPNQRNQRERQNPLKSQNKISVILSQDEIRLDLPESFKNPK